ncbi:MAG: hypothetical protein PPP58_11375 [Natronomonas sp.]
MFTLQMGGAMSVVGLVLFVIAVVLYYLVARYVYRDANSRSMNGTLWGVATFLALFVGLLPGVVVIVVYLIVRD